MNIHDAKAKLSHYLRLVQEGETIIICKRNVPIAEITPAKKHSKRRAGLAKERYPNWKLDPTEATEPALTEKEIQDMINNPIFPEA